MTSFLGSAQYKQAVVIQCCCDLRRSFQLGVWSKKWERPLKSLISWRKSRGQEKSLLSLLWTAWWTSQVEKVAPCPCTILLITETCKAWKKCKWSKNYPKPAKICSLVQWMQFLALDVPKEWVSGNKKDSLVEGGFCSCFPKHLLPTLLVRDTGPGGSSHAAAAMPCASFPDDHGSHVPAAAAGICFQPSHLLALMPSAPLHQQLALCAIFFFPWCGKYGDVWCLDVGKG